MRGLVTLASAAAKTLAETLGWALLCAAAVVAGQAFAYDIGTAPYYGSFGVPSGNPLGSLSTATVQNAVHDATGFVYVLEVGRISKFDRDGNLLLAWNCNGCFGMDVNQATGDVYVTLQPAYVVQQFNSNGVPIRQWGGPGSGDGQFNQPHGIAVDPVTGNVYVFDTANARIQVFDSTGAFLRKFGQAGTGPGDFSGAGSPGGLAFDAVNRWLYATDPPYYRVVKFSESGQFLTKWGDPVAKQPGHFRWPRSVEVDGSGNVYVTDTDSERIQYFTSDGNYLGEFQGPNDVVKGPFHPRDIAINRLTGEKYVNASYAFREDKFDATNAYVKSWGHKFVDGTSIDGPGGIAVSPLNGDVVIVDSGNFLFKRFTEGGAFRSQWGASNRIDITQPGLLGFSDHSALAVAADDSIWTGITSAFYWDDPPEPWVTHFDPNGAVIGYALRKPVSGVNYGEQIRDVAVEPTSGDLFVSDASFNRLKRITSTGSTSIDLRVTTPAGLAFAGGKLYVVNSALDAVQRYSQTLVLEATFGSLGSGPGQFNFNGVSGLAVRASDGHIFVADSWNHRVQELAADGSFVAQRGGYGVGPGQFILPADVALSPAGDLLYVANTIDRRIDMFCLTTTAACSAIVDADADGWPDYQDNCPSVANPSQVDSDSDHIGDACDVCPTDPTNDVDGDGVCGGVDNCPTVYNPDQADRDQNGIGDACDSCPADPLGDYDGDHVCGSVDNCPFVANPLQEDRGGFETSTPDGIGDACQCGDIDSDGAVGAADAVMLRNLLTADPASLASTSALLKCKVSPDGGPCSILDVVVLERALESGGPLMPGVAQACRAANPPSP